MQLEDAPLIIKQGINGEKCASCNQNINTHSHNHEPSSSTTFKKMVYNSEKNKKEDNFYLKSSTSALNLNYLPEIPNIINSNNNLNTILNSKFIINYRK